MNAWIATGSGSICSLKYEIMQFIFNGYRMKLEFISSFSSMTNPWCHGPRCRRVRVTKQTTTYEIKPLTWKRVINANLPNTRLTLRHPENSSQFPSFLLFIFSKYYPRIVGRTRCDACDVPPLDLRDQLFLKNKNNLGKYISNLPCSLTFYYVIRQGKGPSVLCSIVVDLKRFRTKERKGTLNTGICIMILNTHSPTS